MKRHQGPICKECKSEFYLDYLDKPEPHEGSGLCWNCWSDREFERRVKASAVRQGEPRD